MSQNVSFCLTGQGLSDQGTNPSCGAAPHPGPHQLTQPLVFRLFAPMRRADNSKKRRNAPQSAAEKSKLSPADPDEDHEFQEPTGSCFCGRDRFGTGFALDRASPNGGALVAWNTTRGRDREADPSNRGRYGEEATATRRPKLNPHRYLRRLTATHAPRPQPQAWGEGFGQSKASWGSCFGAIANSPVAFYCCIFEQVYHPGTPARLWFFSVAEVDFGSRTKAVQILANSATEERFSSLSLRCWNKRPGALRF